MDLIAGDFVAVRNVLLLCHSCLHRVALLRLQKKAPVIRDRRRISSYDRINVTFAVAVAAVFFEVCDARRKYRHRPIAVIIRFASR